MNDRLYRSATDRVFSGLCGGMADHFDLDPALVRLGWVVLDILTGIFPLLVVYIVVAIVVPEEPMVGAPGPWPDWSGLQWGHTPGAPQAPAAGPGGSPSASSGGQAPSETDTPAQPDAGSAHGGADQGGGAWGPWGSPPPIGADWRTVRAYTRAQRRAQHAYWRSQRRGGDGSTAGLVIGVILVAIGGLFLLRQTVPGFDTALFWPVVLIVLGALLLGRAFRR